MSNSLLSILLYVIAGLTAFAALLTISVVGKFRKPLTGGTAAWVVLFSAADVVVFITAALRL